MPDSRERFTDLLKNEILQLDQPDLDFGIYRILNYRRAEIERFFDDELPAALEKAVAESSTSPQGELPEQSPLAESELDRLYNHLYIFFSRYYRDGDFEPQPRRARNARYSVPYNGEDVHFYWRSFGSHYIKTSEELRSYRFKSGGQAVRFELVAAYQEPDNAKGTTRYFMPIISDCETRAESGGPVFVVPFAFHRLKEDDEKKYGARSAEVEGNTVQERIINDLGARIETPPGLSKTDLLKHLRRYTAKARRDYFVHPNLGPFLRDELDYYLKNEVLNLEGMTSPAAVAGHLRRMGVLRDLGSKVISLLDDMESTHARLFEKARFVLSTEYMVRLSLIPRDVWPALLAEPRLASSWKSLTGNDQEFDTALLETHPSLVIDTALLAPSTRRAVIEGIADIDKSLDGIIISGDNYGALRTLKPSYRDSVDLVYNDPPYNTGGDGFPYKDDFARHSTWLSMMADRTSLCRDLLARDGVLLQSIDENEHIRASLLLDFLFGEKNRLADIIWKNSSKNDQAFVSVQHEYMVGAVKDKSANNGEWTELKAGLEDIYSAFDRFRRQHGDDWEAIHQAALEFYRTLPPGHAARDHKHYNWMDERGVYFASDISGPNFGQYRYDVTHPVTGEICKEPASGWRFPEETMLKRIADGLVHFGPDHTTVPKNKTYLKETESQSLTSVKYRDGRTGSKALENVLGYKAFDNPKDPVLLSQIFGAIVPDDALILDAFAGSGSTAHAVIELNRRDKSRRRFVLIELDKHVDTVLIPRIARLMFCSEWSSGAPVLNGPSLLQNDDAVDSSTRLVKVLRLERFDDSLNSLEPRGVDSDAVQTLEVDRPLRYLAEDVAESRASLNTKDLERPFDYCLNVHTEAGTLGVSIDLAETFCLLAAIRTNAMRWADDGSRDYLLISGTQGQDRVLVVWRSVDDLIPAVELAFLREHVPSLLGRSLDEFDCVWHNADSAIPNGRSLDAEFHRLMFETELGLS